MKINQFYISATINDAGFVPIEYVRLTPAAAYKLDREKFLGFAKRVIHIIDKHEAKERQPVLLGCEEMMLEDSIG